MMRLQTWSLTLMDRWIVRKSLMIRILVAFCDSSNLQKKKLPAIQPQTFHTGKSKSSGTCSAESKWSALDQCCHSRLPSTHPTAYCVDAGLPVLWWKRWSWRSLGLMTVLCPFPAWCQLQAVHTHTLLTIYLNGGMIEHEGYCIYCPASPILWYDITCKEVRVMYVYIAPMYMYIGSLMGYWGNHYLYIYAYIRCKSPNFQGCSCLVSALCPCKDNPAKCQSSKAWGRYRSWLKGARTGEGQGDA